LGEKIINAVRQRLMKQKCRELFGKNVDPIQLFNTLLAGGTPLGSVTSSDLGGPQKLADGTTTVNAAVTTPLYKYDIGTRADGSTFKINNGTTNGATLTINSNADAPFQAGFKDVFGLSDFDSQVLTVIHELGHAAVYANNNDPKASKIKDDVDKPGVSKSNSDKVKSKCF